MAKMTTPSTPAPDLDALRLQAEHTLSARKQLSDPDPIIIEFSGSPKAGKTTAIDIVNHFFRRNGFKVWTPSEGASKRTPFDLKRDLVAFNAWSLNYAIAELLLAFNDVHRYDLVILDRGPFDSLAWMGVLKDRGDLSEQEYEIIRAYALHNKWMSKLARIFLLTCDPEISMRREHDSKLMGIIPLTPVPV
jgi:thymidylate kinase